MVRAVYHVPASIHHNLRESLEAIIVAAGVRFSAPETATPLLVVISLTAGGVVGYFVQK